MSFDPSTRAFKLERREWIFLGLTILFWAGFVVLLGKDTSWDFRNYHWYNPYQLLNGRQAMDVAVAHLGSYYNPYIDVPFYLLATHTTSWFALGVLGAVQGANIVPLYVIARQSLRIPEYELGAAALALLGQTGAQSVSLFGSTYYDNVVSLFILSALAMIVVNRATLTKGKFSHIAIICGGAGFITGSAMGLKLPSAPFTLGFAAALLALGGSWKHQVMRLAAGGIGGVIGVALFAAPWMLRMDALTGNPLFPYFNQYFKSDLVLNDTYRDLRFVPTTFWRQLFFPYLFAIDWHVTGDLGFQDIRVALAYTACFIAAVAWPLRKADNDPLIDTRAALPIFAFSAVTYLVWLKSFAIYRYIVALEMLSPVVLTAAVGSLPIPRRARYVALAALFGAALVVARSDFLDHAPLGDPYIEAAIPPVPHPDKTMVLMTGDAPMGFIATTLPPQIPILRIDGWMLQPKDGTKLTRQMRQRVVGHLRNGGELYLIAEAFDMGRARDALADYNLAILWTGCQLFDTNLVGTYQWCPVISK